ncbi:uncharacterized protein LOC135703654 [Ochlerotatus camptorhynchus]|uniref:uncharacterized protein LOC135703654 n=1 Tax=Ochlerotatus camptorhynchus TaxID=644619 RepID=UPI0031DBA84C
MTSRNCPTDVLAETQNLSQRMRAAYDVSQSSTIIGDAAISLDTLRMNLASLIEQAKIRIHKASVNQTAPLTEKQAKLLNDAIYSASSILRKEEQLASGQNRKRGDADTTVVSGDNFQEQMTNLNKQLNAVSIEMAKLKRANDNIMNIYSNYMLENEECDSEEDDGEDETDSNEENNTIYKRC